HGSVRTGDRGRAQGQGQQAGRLIAFASRPNGRAPPPPRRRPIRLGVEAKLSRRDPDPIVVSAGLQRAPVGGRDVPVHDGTIGPCNLTVGDTRSLHGVIDVDAAYQKQRAQDHSDKRLHDEPPVTAINAAIRYWFRRKRVSRPSEEPSQLPFSQRNISALTSRG